MKVVPLFLSCALILSACNQSPQNTAPAPGKTQAISNKLLIVTVGGKSVNKLSFPSSSSSGLLKWRSLGRRIGQSHHQRH